MLIFLKTRNQLEYFNWLFTLKNLFITFLNLLLLTFRMVYAIEVKHRVSLNSTQWSTKRRGGAHFKCYYRFLWKKKKKTTASYNIKRMKWRQSFTGENTKWSMLGMNWKNSPWSFNGKTSCPKEVGSSWRERYTHIHEKTINVQLLGQKQSAQSITETIIQGITKINDKIDHVLFFILYYHYLDSFFILDIIFYQHYEHEAKWPI